jgi:hypothetical protein
MKRLLTSMVIILAVIVLSASISSAAKGKGAGDGTGPIHQIISEFSYTGAVVDLVPGEGLVLATTEGNVTIYGIGPVRYWKQQKIDRPVVGDEITVNGYVMSLNGVERNIASSITTSEGTIELRDADAKPLWQGNAAKVKRGR